MKKIFCLLGLICAGCGPLSDPCDTGVTACLREQLWVAPPVRIDVLPTVECWDTSHPLSIDELVDLALKNNPITYQTWANARAAAFNWQASQSTLYPTIAFQESLTFNVNSTNGSASVSNTAATGGNVISPTNLVPSGTSATTATSGYNQHVVHNWTLSYLLLDFGGRDATIDLAFYGLMAADWIHNRSLQDVIIAVLRAYYSYELFLGLVEANKLTLHDFKVALDSAEAQYATGVKTHVDVMQAKSNYVNAELALEQAWGNMNIAMGQLAAAVGAPANIVFEVQPLPDKLPIDEIKANVDELIEIAKETRADLSAAYANYEQSLANIVVARSNGLPTITANVDYEWVNNIHFPSQNSSFRSGALVLNVPLFSGFLFINQERQAIAQAEASYAAMQTTESNVLLDVVTAYNTFITAGISVKFSEEFLQYAQEAYNGTLLGYRNGINSITDLTTTLTTLATARSQLVQARAQWFTSLANMAYATGTLYDAL